ncbi:phage minor head protein [Pinisolibacter sp.]|uniref:phage minor head protein n=1 Tax=Pinisolibacter sp. TaxID=2172024 RepID=UPI002FDD20E7
MGRNRRTVPTGRTGPITARTVRGTSPMTLHRADTYRLRFDRYLRQGTSIELPLERKDDLSPERYVWRSRRDEKVRPAHRANDGRIFSWSTPPETGHPGMEPDCRCVAVPHREGETEFAEHTFTSGLASSYGRWEDSDFVWHLFTGGGRTVTLEEIGHLREIAEYHAYSSGGDGAFRRLSDQIADAARDSTPGSVHHDFGKANDFGDVAFSHGNSTVAGAFDGTAERRGNMISIAGETNFNFYDVFTGPVDLRDFAA